MDNWIALIEQLNRSPADIHVLNRAQLISDSFNLARAGHLNYTVPLLLSKYLRNENSVTPWYSVKDCFSYLLEHMSYGVNGHEALKVCIALHAPRHDQRVGNGGK
jgi:aminopeptidase N